MVDRRWPRQGHSLGHKATVFVANSVQLAKTRQGPQSPYVGCRRQRGGQAEDRLQPQGFSHESENMREKTPASPRPAGCAGRS